MNKTTHTLLATATAFFALSSAHAQEAAPKLYAEVGYTQMNARASDGVTSLKFSPKAVTGVFGYQFTPNMAVEGMLGFGADSKVKSAVGVFFKPSVAVSESIDLFGRLGWVHSELELSAAGVSMTDKGSDLAYGVGANFNLSKSSYIQANWMTYYMKDQFKIDGFNVAYGFRF